MVQSRWPVTGASGGESSPAAPMADGGGQRLRRACARKEGGGVL
jgi:hypothetical protein